MTGAGPWAPLSKHGAIVKDFFQNLKETQPQPFYLGAHVSDCLSLLLGQCLSLSSYLLPPSPLPLSLPLITPSSTSLPLLLFRSLCSFPPSPPPALSPLPFFLSVSLTISAHLCGRSDRQGRARNPHQTTGWWSERGAQLSRGPPGHLLL